MNEPERRNAMGTKMLVALLQALEEASEASEVRAVVLCGAEGAFSSGADVSEALDQPGAARRMEMFCRLYETVTTFPKPTVAAIDGHCIGGGAEAAGACDLRVGTARSSFMFPGARFEIPIGAARLGSLIGLSHAKDLLMTSRSFDGAEAYRLGFLNRLLDPDALEGEAQSLAETMTSNPGAILQKRLLDEAVELTARVRRENRALKRRGS